MGGGGCTVPVLLLPLVEKEAEFLWAKMMIDGGKEEGGMLC